MDAFNQIDTSNVLFDKLNNSKENKELLGQIKKPMKKPRKLEPLGTKTK